MAQDPSLRDEQLENEIRLVGDLVLAASESEARLPQDAIDAILGLEPAGTTDVDAAPEAPEAPEGPATPPARAAPDPGTGQRSGGPNL